MSVLKVGDGMATLAMRSYTTQPGYWEVYFGVRELVKNAWDASAIQGPVPHRVLYKNKMPIQLGVFSSAQALLFY